VKIFNKNVFLLNGILLVCYFIFWLICDLLTIYSSDPYNKIGTLLFNLLATLPIASAWITWMSLKEKNEILRSRIIFTFLITFIVTIIGVMILMLSGTVIHFAIGGSK